MADKVSVKGADIAPIFKYLTDEAKKIGVEDPVKWNFTKFLVDKNGEVVKRYAPNDTPESIKKDLAQYLK